MTHPPGGSLSPRSPIARVLTARRAAVAALVVIAAAAMLLAFGSRNGAAPVAPAGSGSAVPTLTTSTGSSVPASSPPAAIASQPAGSGHAVSPAVTGSPAPPRRSPAPTPTRQPPAATPRPSASPRPTGSGLAGTWHVANGSTAAAVVTAGIGPFQGPVTARTPAVTGTAEVRAAVPGSRLSASAFVVDVTTLTTGSALEDDQLQSILETGVYPSARFEQTGSVSLPGDAVLRDGATITLAGSLTLRGITRHVVVDAHIVLAGQQISVSSLISFRLADYGIRGSGLVSVGETGTMEFRLVLAR